MFWPLTIIGAGLLVARNRTRTGYATSYDIRSRLQTPSMLRSPRARERVIEAMAVSHTLIGIEYLNEYPTPPLYQSGVVYCDDGKFSRFDDWRDIPTTLKKGCGNCAALVPWRLAELWRGGRTDAEPLAIEQPLKDGNTLYHLLIRYVGSSETEDPSARLGMR